MTAIPQAGQLVIRRIPFNFPSDVRPIWNAGHREWSHMVNGASLAMPYLEPFLIHSMREALPDVADEQVVAEARAFMAQEGQHYRTHRRYNELLKAGGYPQLADVEAAMDRSFTRLRAKRSLTFRLAYACGFETMTLGITRWLVDERTRLFGGSDSRVASFILWHFVEETEHKRVAFDVYSAARGSYWPRVLGVFTGSLHVFLWSRQGCKAMLKADGKWWNPRSRLRLWLRTAEFFAAVIPGALRSLRRDHNPEDRADPAWARDWIAGYALLDDASQVPLVDTCQPEFPVPFPSWESL